MKPYTLIISVALIVLLLCSRKSVSQNIDLRDVEFVSEELNINNIRALINSNGMLFGKLSDGENPEIVPGTFSPNDSDKSTILLSNLWLTVTDPAGNHFVACNKYLNGMHGGVHGSSSDFFNGVKADEYDQAYDSRWVKIWSLSRNEIEYHKANFNNQGYVPSDNILNWPVHGDFYSGEEYYLLPFHDNLNNKYYNVYDGDYPLIRGDKCLFFTINDFVHQKTETENIPIGFEIHVWVYAYSAPWDPILNNTVFVHYDLFQKYRHPIGEAYIGIFNDFAIGDPSDDFGFTDVRNSSYIQYNGDAYDEVYGEFTPAQSCTILAGPYAKVNGEDDSEITANDDLYNGLGLNDGEVDNERLMISHSFIYDVNSQNEYNHLPVNTNDYTYNSMGAFNDGENLYYGGVGRYDDEDSWIESRFLYTGDSDPDFFSSDGFIHEDFVDINWTEDSVENMPGNRQGYINSGPWNFYQRDHQEFDIAFVFAQSNDPNMSSFDLLRGRLSELHERVWVEKLMELHHSELGEQKLQAKVSCKIYPNPASNILRIKVDGVDINGLYAEVMSVDGRLCSKIKIINDSLDLTSLVEGQYFLQIISEDFLVREPFFVIR
jgi:hypothetical protein